ncbi:MAG: hypothetical protein KGM15_00045 [Pseudomonadota bacterium]|nr:hypothetical protein [Pseudomonadota bacterium]
MRISTWGTFFVLLAMVGSFFAGNYLVGGVSSTKTATASDIIEEAKKSIPPVVLPPKPAGHSVTSIRRVTTQVPESRIENKMVNIGPFKTSIPQVVTSMKEVSADVPTTTLVDASPEEIAKWNEEAKAAENKYQSDLNAKINQISAERQHQRNEEIMNETKTVVTEMIIPLITAITGLLGALTAFKYGNRPPNQST